MINKKDESESYFLRQFISIVKGMSDLEYQKKVWKRGEGYQADSFDDTVENFFSFFEAIFQKKSNFINKIISTSQITLIKRLHAEFEKYSEKNPEEINRILTDPNWQKIIKLSQQLYKNFRENPILFHNIPSEWEQNSSYNGNGYCFINPNIAFTTIRIMIGQPNNPFVIRRKYYVRHFTPHGFIDKNGKVCSELDIQSYIPIEEYDYNLIKDKVQYDFDKKVILKNLINGAIKRLGDIEFQKRVWIKAEGEEIDCLEETCSILFDDHRVLFEQIENKHDQYGIRLEKAKMLTQLKTMMDEMRNQGLLWEPDILQDPKWLVVVEAAAQAYAKLKA